MHRDMIEVSDAEVLYTYGDTFYDKFAAVTRKSQGQGMVYYVACSLDEAAMKLVMGRIMEDNSIRARSQMMALRSAIEVMTYQKSAWF